MTEDEKLKTAFQLQLQLADYWHDVDTNWGRNAGDYYTDDAVFEASKTKYVGKPKIREFYQWRLDRGARVAVHGFMNFRVTFHDDSNATSTWYLILYANDGQPILPSAPPIQIALMTDTLVRNPDGRWLYSYRKFGVLFEGGVPTTSPILDGSDRKEGKAA